MVILVFNLQAKVYYLAMYSQVNHQEHTDVMFIKVDQEKDVSFEVPVANVPIYICHCTPRTFKINAIPVV